MTSYARGSAILWNMSKSCVIFAKNCGTSKSDKKDLMDDHILLRFKHENSST